MLAAATTAAELEADVRYFGRQYEEAVATVQTYERFAAEHDAKGEATRADLCRRLAEGARKGVDRARAEYDAAVAALAAY